jgi:NAD(P)-dependent dehydrogenase (short-subunit alcohol dehydrogenase family)
MKSSALFDIRGLVAFVTGAASGLGLAYAEVLAENGAQVTLADIDDEGAAKAAARLRGAGYAAEPLTLDVRDTGRLIRAIADVAKKRGRLDVVFANAGISAGPGPVMGGTIDAVDLDAWEAVHKINLTSVFVTLRAAATAMKPQRSGRIIVTASIAGLRSEAMCGYGYTSTKAAIINIVRHAAMELAPFNILVNAIAPGPFLTNIAGGRLHSDPAAAAAWAETVPLGRVADPDEIKGLALLLASPASSFITGTVIPIDGGSMAR